MKIKSDILEIIFYFILVTQFFLLSITCFSQSYIPPQGKTLLVIGQDLESEYNYVNAGYFPTPGGITSYINLYDIRNASAYYPFGGLGEDQAGNAVSDVDWGSGPLNTHNAAIGYPNSALSIGLYMTEDYYPDGLSKIANGDYDAEINRLATFLQSIDKPVFLRIGYEFDGQWNTGYENTTNYKNAWKRIVDIIRPVAPKTMMVWQACTSPVDDILEGYHENIEDWYPGDEYVDYVGYSWFLSTQQQVDLTNELVSFARTKGKPVMACEASPQGYDLNNLTYRYINTMLGGAPGTNPVSKTPDQIWSEWFQPYFQYIHDNSDIIKAVAYINADWDSQPKWGSPYNEGYWGDSRVETNAGIRQKWLNEINTSFWLHGSDQLFNILAGNGGNGTVNQAPSLRFTSPVSSSLTTGDNLYVKISASDDDTIEWVKLYVNNAFLRAETLAPYEWGISSGQDPLLFHLVKGNYWLKAEVSDSHGHVTSDSSLVTVADTPVQGENFAPPAGKTLLMIGQTYIQEYQDYINATGKVPAGSSHYAELYTGKINQGDDANNEAFLDYIESNYPESYCELAISIKDNPAAGGYSGPNAVWQACKDIPTGKWDTQIDQIAASMKSRPSLKFLVRIGYEVSLNMFANQTTTNFIDILNKYTSKGINPLEKANEIPEFDLQAYKDAFNYIAKRIRDDNGVSNVNFIFHPVRGFSDAKWLYPGDQYVDWFGLSIFNHDVCWSTWEGANPPFVNCPESQAMDANVKKCLDWAKDSIHKPIIIAESAVQADVNHQNTADFADGYLQKIYDLINTYDVKAWVYINSDWLAHNWSSQWGDSRVQKNDTTLQFWKNEVFKPRYIHYPSLITGVLPAKSGSLNATEVYPNPTAGTFSIVKQGSYSMEIRSPEGQLIRKESFTGNAEIAPNLKAGMYLLMLKNDSGADIIRLIIK